MILSEGFVHLDFSYLVCKLKKAIYDLKQAPKAWFLKLSGCLTDWGFRRFNSNAYMMVYNKNGDFIIFLIYVDDIKITVNNFKLIQYFI